MNTKLKLITGAMALLALPFLAFESWQKPSQPPHFNELTSVIQHPTDPQKIIAASPREILERNGSGSWKNLWFPKSTQRIHKIIRPDAYPNKLIVLTDAGAYEYVSENASWKTLFEKHNKEEYSVFSFTILPGDPDHLFVGTKSGLFESFDGGKIWYPFSAFQRDPIHLLRCSDAHLYVGTDQKLFRSENLTDFKEIFFLSARTGEELSEESDLLVKEEFSEEIQTKPSLYDLILDFSELQEKVWLGTNQGVFESRDTGKSWKRLPLHGLRSQDVRHLVYAVSAHQLWAGTPRGVYRFNENKQNWEEVSAGLENPNIWALTFMNGNPGKLLAVTPIGFSEWPILPDNVQIISSPEEIPDGVKMSFRDLIAREPSIREVNRHVIKDSNTNKWKTKRWHLESRLKTLLPDVSFSKDMSRGTSIDLDRGGTSDLDRYILGPDDVNRGWDFGVSWDLSEFIWSTAQTSIDSRDKMMTEFRHALLAETARTYFERRRLQMEILFAPTATEQEHFEKLLRLEELTALLDSLTGGWYGKRLEKLGREYPEVEKVMAYHGSNTDRIHGSNTDHEK